MSAFEVSTVHIDALLTAGLDVGGPDRLGWFWPAVNASSDRGSWTSAEHVAQARDRSRELTVASAGRVGAMLAAENRRSIDHRYDEAQWEQPYEFRELPGPVDPVIVLKALDCYEYQSCEHPGWEASEAYAFCQAVRSRMIGRLPGYDGAPWEITDTDVFRQAARTRRSVR